MLHTLQISFVGKSCVSMEYQRQSSPTATSSSWVTFGRLYAPSSESSSCSHPHTILKPTAKRRWRTIHYPLYFACWSRRTSRSGRSVYPSPSTPTTVQDIRRPASPPSRSSTASTRCPHWTFYRFLYKSAPIWTQVLGQATSRRCMRIQGTPSSAQYNDSRPSSMSTSDPWSSTLAISCGYTFVRTASPTNTSPNFYLEPMDHSRC